MRTIFYLIIISIVLESNPIGAQKLVQEGNQWNVYYPPTFEPSFHTSLIGIMNDTIIDSIVYNKLGIKQSINNEEFVFNNSYMREDSTKKVYLKNGNQEEFVLYDFSLDTGDTISFDSYCSLVVTEIDSIALNNGEKRKRMKLDGINTPYESTFWIEGIGSVLGVDSHIINFCAFDAPAVLLCFYSDDELLYPESPPSCYLTDVNELIVDPNITIYPNPFDDQITFTDTERIFDNYYIYDTQGKLVLEGNVESDLTEIHTKKLKGGVYYLTLVTDNGHFYTEILVRN